MINNYPQHKIYRDKALEYSNDLDKASEYLEKVDLERLDYQHKVFMSGVYMKLGILDEGFKLYQNRIRNDKYDDSIFKFDKNKYWNSEITTDKTICIVAEQGFGDFIMWARYLLLFNNTKILLYLPDPFYKKIIPVLDFLFKQCALHNKLEISDTVGNYNYWVFLADLPYRFKTTLDNWPKFRTYIHAEKKYIDKWKKLLGNMNKENIYKENEYKLIAFNLTGMDGSKDSRRLELKNFNIVLEKKGYKFINLNLDFPVHHKNVLELPKLDQDYAFCDTVAIMTLVERVISVDTSIIHVAGAMNMPATLILGVDSEWRWFLNRSDSPWYPSLTLFRQSEKDNWDGLEKIL